MATVERVYAAQATDPSLTEHWSGPPELVDRIASRLGTTSEHLVVDVATGVGGPARRLATLTGCDVVGVDRVFDVVRRARRAAVGVVRGRVRLVAGSATALPLPSGVADQLWCLGAIAHIEDLDAFASEAARVLRHGAPVALTETFAARIPPRFARAAPQPWRPIAVADVLDALRRAGFVAVSELPWPATVEDSPPSDDLLAADLRDGALSPALVTARRE